MGNRFTPTSFVALIAAGTILGLILFPVASRLAAPAKAGVGQGDGYAIAHDQGTQAYVVVASGKISYWALDDHGHLKLLSKVPLP
jgi:hypothetical protein